MTAITLEPRQQKLYMYTQSVANVPQTRDRKIITIDLATVKIQHVATVAWILDYDPTVIWPFEMVWLENLQVLCGVVWFRLAACVRAACLPGAFVP